MRTINDIISEQFGNGFLENRPITSHQITNVMTEYASQQTAAIAAERDEYRKALEQIAEHDGEILFPGNSFFSSVSVASESLAKYPQQ